MLKFNFKKYEKITGIVYFFIFCPKPTVTIMNFVLLDVRFSLLQIFDAIIITASLAFDIVFLGGMFGAEGEKAAAVLVVLLLWRITRVIDGT